MYTVRPILEAIVENRSLSQDLVREAFEAMLTGRLTEAQSGALLLGLRARGETSEELSAAVEAALGQAVLVTGLTGDRIDTCGTGGDCRNSFNCSTAVALFLADMGYAVVKHGNRAVSSACGSADAIEALGLPMTTTPAEAAEELKKRNFAFLFAPHFHPAFRHVAPIRKALGIRTLFNLMGPLLNPARPTHQILGVPDMRFAPMMAEVLAAQGLKRAAVVHGAGGYDELSPCGESSIVFVEDGQTRRDRIHPKTFGLPEACPEDLECPTKETAVAALKKLLSGQGAAGMASMVTLNLGLAIHLLEPSMTLEESVALAWETVARGLRKELDHA
ncbi:MAG: anthranilate phosphoribosyltransferase [Deltaproteobacteria bacterium]|nr:anthranilate phosphoribosyltransferase [Deltaproteobacteria bacterium]